MNCKPFLNSILIIFLSTAVLSAAPDLDKGKTLFKDNCASCHNKNMKDDMTGPALGGAKERWASYPKEDLTKWMRNSQSLIKSGHPRATELFAKWKTTMTPFPNLTDQDIDDVFAYIEGVNNGTYGPKAAVAGPGAANTGTSSSSGFSWWLYGIFALLGIIALFLWNIISDLNYSKSKSEGDSSAHKKTVFDLLTSRTVIGFVLFGIILFGGYTTVNNAISVGSRKNYAPDQPIKFSHATHAGLNKVDCHYCHDGARRSKQSIIPGSSTCMNCHAAIKVGSKYGTAEITKIYASIGFDPEKGTYIENYNKLSNEDIQQIYSKWIASNILKEKKTTTLTEGDQNEVDRQIRELTASLTSEEKPSIAGPIEWVRIHNLPDHVYFNHSQHVTVGKVACQQCHGKIENMEVVKQYSPLSMGWCINCHRETDVKFADNKYYDAYKTYHDEIKSGERKSVKVADIGGLECQKCHY